MNAALIKCEIESAPHGAKRAIAQKYADLMNVSVDSIYRMIRDKYGPAKVVKKEKKVDQKIIDEIAKFKLMGKKLGLKERELSTELCLNHIESMGYKVEGSLSTINRRLAESGFRMRKSIVRVEAEYSNQMHQLDFSRSKYFQLWRFDKKSGDFILKVAKQLTYKENDNKLSSWLVGITDAYSRISLARMYAASGESAAIGIDFLNYIYNRPLDEHPLRYLPDILKTDNGAFIKNQDVKQMLASLEIKSELTKPYEKHGIQKQESAWRRLWQRFELDLAMKVGSGKTILLNEYNELIEIHYLNDLKADHPVKAGSRVHVYMSSLAAHPVRTIDVDLSDVAFRVITRTVGDDLLISVNTEKYKCPLFAIGKQIRVYKNRSGELVGELIDEFRKPFVLKPTEGFVTVGNFEHRENQSYVGKMEEEIAAKKRAVENKKRKIEESNNEAAGTDIKYFPPREEKFEPETKFTKAVNDEVVEFATEYEAKKYIVGKLIKGEDYAKYADVFDELLSKTLKREFIDRMLGAIYQSNVRTG